MIFYGKYHCKEKPAEKMVQERNQALIAHCGRSYRIGKKFLEPIATERNDVR